MGTLQQQMGTVQQIIGTVLRSQEATNQQALLMQNDAATLPGNWVLETKMEQLENIQMRLLRARLFGR